MSEKCEYEPEEFFVCTCSSHAISLVRYPNDPYDDEIEIALWQRGSTGIEFSWWDRLRFIWRILAGGQAGADWVSLSRADAIRLAAKLNEWTNKTTGKSG